VEISREDTPPENTRSYQPDNFRTKQKKIKKFARGGVYTWVGKGYFSERAQNSKI
jgi:hypothetical protein